MKQQLTLLLIIAQLTSLIGQEKINDLLILVKENGKTGYINFEGEAIIPVEFDAVKWFSEAIIPINKGAVEKDYEPIGGKWGFWGRDGQELIPPKYEDAKIFREGLAAVKQNGKYGFIDKEDKVRIAFQYEDAQPFQEGLAAVKIAGKWGFINRQGQLTISPSFHRVKDFQNGFSIVFHLITQYEYEDDGDVYMEEEGKYGLIDNTGQLKLDTIYDYINEFKNGFAQITLERKKGFIDTTGEIVIPIRFDQAGEFSEGLAAVGNYMIRDSYHQFGYSQQQIDSLEKEVEKLYDQFGNDFNGLRNHPTYRVFRKAKMQQPSEQLTYGYIDEQGTMVIDFQFDQAGPFKNGFAKIRFGSSSGFSVVMEDGEGNELPSYGERIGTGANLIDKKGNLQLDKNQRILNRCKDHLFVSYNYKGAGASDENFKEVIANQYQNLGYLGSGYFVAELKKSQKKKLIGNGIELELDENFFRVDKAVENRFLVDYIVGREDYRVITKSGIINEKGEWVLKPKYDFSMIEFGK